ncbi:MAG: VWA domain-containing protein [Paracoccaceae bacterium]
MIRSIGLLLAAFLIPTSAMAEGKSIIVLDGSGSMWGQIDGRPKLEIAREALAEVLAGLPADTEIGLMAYGHRTKGDCADIELIVPPAAGTAQAITDAANAMQFLGKTPLSDAVRKAAEDLRSTEEKATVILITDGIETCNADPCALGTELEASGVDFTAHVVGFGLTKDEGKAVACLAENTGGKYIEAKDTSSLVEALKTAVAVPEPEPQPQPEPQPALPEKNVAVTLRLTAGGPEIIDGPILNNTYFEFWTVGSDGKAKEWVNTTIAFELTGTVPPGSYIMRSINGPTVVDQPVEISATELSTPQVVLNAGILAIKVLSEEGGTPDQNGYFEMVGNGLQTGGYGEGWIVFPAGSYDLSTRLGEMNATESVTITAGEILEKTIIMGVGIPVFTAYYAEGVPVEGSQSFEVFDAKVGMDGSRNRVMTIYDAGSAPKLPPGDYVVLGQAGQASAEVAFTVKPGQRIDVPVILNAGIAAITAPNAKSLSVFDAKVGLDGNRERILTEYGDAFQLILPAGDYIAAVEVDQATAEAPFTVKPAERTELTVTMAVGMAAVRSAGADVIEIFEAKIGLDGTRKRVSSDYGELVERMLPPGDYIAEARAGKATAEAPFTVKDGERSEVTVQVAFGIAAVSAPGARVIAIYPAAVGLDGKRQHYVASDYGETSEATLPPGDYVAEAEYDDKTTVESAFTLSDQQRTEVALTKP